MKLTFITISLAILSISFIASTKKNITPDHKFKKNFKEEFARISGGKLSNGDKETIIPSLLVSKGEVTNANYRFFIEDLKKRGDATKLAIAQVDSNLWNTPSGHNNQYKDFYFNHPAYRKYPVVNVTKEGAELYCEWLTEEYAKVLGDDKRMIFRLPTHEEWKYLARGGNQTAVYAWEGYYMRNESGQIMANFLHFGEGCITRDSISGFKITMDGYPKVASAAFMDVTAPTKSYWPNSFDLYNMCGNVEELVADKAIVVGGSWFDPGYDIRIESSKDYKGAGPTIGFRVVAEIANEDLSWLK